MATESEKQVTDKKTEEELTMPNVDKFWISVLTFYLVLLGIILFWGLVAFFPCEIASDPAASTCSESVGFMLWSFPVTNELRMIVLGGERILKKLHDAQGDVFRHRPRLERSDWVYMLVRALRSR